MQTEREIMDYIYYGGRKRIKSDLGEKRVFSFWLYPSEYAKLKIEYQKIKALRKKYETKLPNATDIKRGRDINETNK